MADKLTKDTILNIPQLNRGNNTTTTTSLTPNTSSRATPTAPASSEVSEQDFDPSEADEFEDGGIGEFDDGRSGKITLGVLIQDGVIEAGDGVMAVDYLGQTFKGDLLTNGKIKSQETGLVFNNPSAWAIYCKKIVNPSKKSGCGERWASVKYKGRKMDQFKNIWTKMKAKKEADEVEQQQGITNSENDTKSPSSQSQNGFTERRPIIIKHSQLGPKHPSDHTSMLVDVDTFQSQGKIQPFTVSLSSSAMLILDLHSHMVKESVTGYLAGQWDLNAHNLAITHAFPCLTSTQDPEEAHKVETEVYGQIYGQHLSLVGWYRSTPGLPGLPSLKDSEAQLDYQIKLLGNSDSSYSPCVGIMTSPFTSMSNESNLLAYWVIPPPDTIPVEYGKPMKMEYSVVTDPCLSQEALNQITLVIQYYQSHPRRVKFVEQYNSDTKFITKMGRTLLPKFPRDQDERLWRYIRKLILRDSDSEIDDPLLIRPPVSTNGSSTVNGSSNTTAISNASRRNSSRKNTHDEDEEEIDDDEENALASNVRNGGGGSSDMSTPPVPTEDVISLLLQRQMPVSGRTPIQAAALPTNTTSENNSSNSNKNPLDFSSSANSKDTDSNSKAN